MPFLTYQSVIGLVLSLPTRRGAGVIMNVSVWKHRSVKKYIFLLWQSLLFEHHFRSCPDVDFRSQLSV
jgi:hypothetical protein